MKFFIANNTDQHQIIAFVVPGKKGTMQQSIPPGQQRQIGSDMTTPEVNSIVEQLRKYGLMDAAEIGSSPVPNFVPYVFSCNRPVPSDLIRRLIEHNRGVLKIRGADARRQAAIETEAVLQEIGETQGGEPGAQLLKFDSSVQTESAGSGLDPTDPIGEGFSIERDATKEPARRGARPRKK